MKELVELMIKALVDDHDAIVIKETEGDSVIVIEVSVAPDEAGKVIGKSGRIANAIRTIVKSAAIKQGKKVALEIIAEDNRSE